MIQFQVILKILILQCAYDLSNITPEIQDHLDDYINIFQEMTQNPSVTHKTVIEELFQSIQQYQRFINNIKMLVQKNTPIDIDHISYLVEYNIEKSSNAPHALGLRVCLIALLDLINKINDVNSLNQLKNIFMEQKETQEKLIKKEINFELICINRNFNFKDLIDSIDKKINLINNKNNLTDLEKFYHSLQIQILFKDRHNNLLKQFKTQFKETQFYNIDTFVENVIKSFNQISNEEFIKQFVEQFSDEKVSEKDRLASLVKLLDLVNNSTINNIDELFKMKNSIIKLVPNSQNINLNNIILVSLIRMVDLIIEKIYYLIIESLIPDILQKKILPNTKVINTVPKPINTLGTQKVSENLPSQLGCSQIFLNAQEKILLSMKKTIQNYSDIQSQIRNLISFIIDQTMSKLIEKQDTSKMQELIALIINPTINDVIEKQDIPQNMKELAQMINKKLQLGILAQQYQELYNKIKQNTINFLFSKQDLSKDNHLLKHSTNNQKFQNDNKKDNLYNNGEESIVQIDKLIAKLNKCNQIVLESQINFHDSSNLNEEQQYFKKLIEHGKTKNDKIIIPSMMDYIIKLTQLIPEVNDNGFKKICQTLYNDSSQLMRVFFPINTQLLLLKRLLHRIFDAKNQPEATLKSLVDIILFNKIHSKDFDSKITDKKLNKINDIIKNTDDSIINSMMQHVNKTSIDLAAQFCNNIVKKSDDGTLVFQEEYWQTLQNTIYLKYEEIRRSSNNLLLVHQAIIKQIIETKDSLWYITTSPDQIKPPKNAKNIENYIIERLLFLENNHQTQTPQSLEQYLSAHQNDNNILLQSITPKDLPSKIFKLSLISTRNTTKNIIIECGLIVVVTICTTIILKIP